MDAMLKTPTSPPDNERDAQGEASSDLAEARMRQALEKLSAGAPPSRTGGFSAGHLGAKPARHRYVQDGEVIVEHATATRGRGAGSGPAPVAGPEARFTELQAALATERAAREQAERAQERALVTARALETRLKHTEVALREALDQAGARETELTALRAELRKHVARREAEQETALAREPEPVKWWIKNGPVAKRAVRRTKQLSLIHI